MSVYVDTSAWYAVMSTGDEDHAAAGAIYQRLVETEESLVTSSYALAETMGLLQHRLGWKALERFAATALTIDVAWIDGALHELAEAMLFKRRRRGTNIVDTAGFAVMRSLGLDTAFAFDDDFVREGFKLLRAPTR